MRVESGFDPRGALRPVRSAIQRAACVVLASGTLLAPAAPGQEPVAPEEAPFAVAEGFVVSTYAGPELLHDCTSLTLDAQGRVVVSSPGRIDVLIDEDGDGVADTTQRFHDGPKGGARGMLFDGPHLIFTGGGGLWRLRDDDHDGRADGPPEKWAELRNPEHGANGLVRGPGGRLHLVCGNDSGLSAQHVSSPDSPIRVPNMGGVLRFSAQGDDFEILAHGFRNPYDLVFHPNGSLLIVDADGERDQHLPWYSPTRLFDVAIGGHHGWVIEGWRRAWNRPPHWFDTTERAAELGRGSPTGMEVVRHRAWPPRYRDGVFSICWTLGRVWFVPLSEEGSILKGTPEVFLQTQGHIGFAPVDLAVGADGSMYVAIGGRGTRGGVYRVRPESVPEAVSSRRPADTMDEVLDADQPAAAWSRRDWWTAAQILGREAFVEAAADPARRVDQRRRAIEILVDTFGGLGLWEGLRIAPELDFRLPSSRIEQTEPDADATPAPILAHTIWALSCPCDESIDPPLPRETFFRDLHQLRCDVATAGVLYPHPLVQRRAWEALIDLGPDPDTRPSSEAWSAAAHSPDRRVRALALRCAVREGLRGSPDEGRDDAERRFVLQAWMAQEPQAELPTDTVVSLLRGDRPLDTLRALQLAIGDVELIRIARESQTGYLGSGPDPERRLAPFRPDLRELAAHEDPAVATEAIRLIAMIGGEDAEDLDAVLGRIVRRGETAAAEPIGDLHRLLASARLRAPRSPRHRDAIARAFAGLHAGLEAEKRLPSRNWPLRVGECFARHLELDPELATAIGALPHFGRVEHTLFVEPMDGSEARLVALRRLLTRASKAGPDQGWSPALVRLLRELPHAEVLAQLRMRFSDPQVRDEIALSLAAHPDARDRARLTAALGSVRAAVVRSCAQALCELPPDEPPRLDAVLRAMRQHRESRPEDTVDALRDLLRRWSGLETADDDRAFLDWLHRAHPEQALRLGGFAPTEGAQWRQRLAGIDFSAGDAERGRVLYVERRCADCHDGSRRLGPALDNLTRRFDRFDLFASIVRPSEQISPLYRAVQVRTRDGQTLVGVPVYQSPDGTILETEPGQLVRFADHELLRTEPVKVSPMPTGLLDGLTDEQLADLWTYLDANR